MSRIKIIENNSELGAGTRGSSLGIEAMKIASIKTGSQYFAKYEKVVVPNNNQLLYNEIKYDRAKRINGIIEIFERVSKSVTKELKSSSFPIVLSGDHSSAGGTIAGIKMAYPDKRLGVIWIDAHADLHSPYTSPSGNIHGMPLATALGTDNLDHKVNEISDDLKTQWDKLKNLGDICPKINPSDLVFIAVRDTEDPEDYFIEKNKIKCIEVEQVRREGPLSAVKETLQYLKKCDLIYISFDVDSLDCDLVSYGTGTPVSNGLTEQEANALINNFLLEKKVCCLEVVEINPCLDNKQNRMAETAFRILESATNIIEKRG